MFVDVTSLDGGELSLVSIEDGTGVVHIAPTFGADDAMVAKGAGVPGLTLMTANGDVRPMVDLQGKFFLLKDLDESCVKETINVDLYKAFFKSWHWG